MKNLYIAVLRSLCITIVILCTTVQAEFFSAISDLEKLIYTEQEVTAALQEYIELEEKRIQKIQKFSQQYAELYKTAKLNKEMFLSNPVNAYVLLKHLTKDWEAATGLIKNSDGQNLINDLLDEGTFPNQEDLSGAATALIRLQHIYLLETESIAQGRINGTQATFELTAADCFELGKQAYDAHFAEYSIKWMLETLKRLEKESNPSVSRVEVMEYITYSAYDVSTQVRNNLWN